MPPDVEAQVEARGRHTLAGLPSVLQQRCSTRLAGPILAGALQFCGKGSAEWVPGKGGALCLTAGGGMSKGRALLLAWQLAAGCWRAGLLQTSWVWRRGVLLPSALPCYLVSLRIHSRCS